jgi:hypothetical protein
MKNYLTITLLALLLSIASVAVRAEDKAVAAAFASGAAKLAADGKTDKAKELCYKALANDENCPEALFELGKIFEKENNNAAAADFLVRAARELGNGEAASPAFASKRKECETRILRLNPYATRYTSALADYTQDLNTNTKKSADALTLEEACERADMLHLRAVLPPDKAPKFERPATVSVPTKKEPNDPISRIRRMNGEMVAPVVTNVPPDVERALKAAGFEKITGTWKKKADNVYEVTDGKLETAKINGALQAIVHKGGTGHVKVMVRNNQEDYSGSSLYSYGSGFGYAIEGEGAKCYAPSGGYSNGKYYSYMEREDPIPAGLPKTLVTITVDEGKLEYFLNNVSKKRANYPISKSGPFVIEIKGTATIESPMAKGQ